MRVGADPVEITDAMQLRESEDPHKGQAGQQGCGAPRDGPENDVSQGQNNCQKENIGKDQRPQTDTEACKPEGETVR